MTDAILDTLEGAIEVKRAEEERETLTESLSSFIKAAWHTLKPEDPLHWNWHIDAICGKLEKVSRGEIPNLQVWVPPATMKSLTASVFWPAWEWTWKPSIRYWTASYALDLSGEFARMCQDVMNHEWYRRRWGHLFEFSVSGMRRYANNRGGTRLATAPGSTALGWHGHRILIDDPINAGAADATSRAQLNSTNEWYDAAVQSRKIDPARASEVIIMQRLHENDLAAHALEVKEWDVLCLPEEYEHDHPHVWEDDPRKEDGELLWPDYRPRHVVEALKKGLRHRAAGQLQQRPAAREGQLLNRYWWRFYDPRLFQDEKQRNRWPRFTLVVISVDTPQKDKQTNDLIAIQAWAVIGADRYLIDLKKGHLSYGQAKRAIREQYDYVKKLFPKARRHVLIENAGYGVELIAELKQEVTGVLKIQKNDEGTKEVRADAAAADLEGGNCFIPGYRTGPDETSPMDEARSPADIVEFVEECANFPNAKYDDQVDAWSQAMNWLRARPQRRARTWSSHKVAR